MYICIYIFIYIIINIKIEAKFRCRRLFASKNYTIEGKYNNLLTFYNYKVLNTFVMRVSFVTAKRFSGRALTLPCEISIIFKLSQILFYYLRFVCRYY